MHFSNAAAMRGSIRAMVRTMTGWKPTPAPISPNAEVDSYSVSWKCGQCSSRAMVSSTPAMPPPTMAMLGASLEGCRDVILGKIVGLVVDVDVCSNSETLA